MKGTLLGLLVLMLPSLVSAAVFNWNRHGRAPDGVLKFEPGHNRRDGSVSRQQADDTAAPAFCNHLDCPEFRVIKDEPTYQLREYAKSRWVSTTSVGIDYDEASYTDFMRLFKYIGGNNVKKEKIAMTAPVLNSIIPGPGPACADNFTMSFFIAPKVIDPPQPSNKDVFLSQLPKVRVYVRSFSGFANEKKWLQEALELAKDLEGKATYIKDYYYTAGYNSPFQLTNRHNEIWFIAL